MSLNITGFCVSSSTRNVVYETFSNGRIESSRKCEARSAKYEIVPKEMGDVFCEALTRSCWWKTEASIFYY